MSATTSRILLFTGKGGVGKTTAAAATALRCADAGLRTIVLSTDPAHSLADAFDRPLGAIGTPITDMLWGQQLDAQERMEDAWADIQSYVIDVLGWAGVDAIEAEELSVVPGLDEIFSLSDIKAYASSGEWDVVVVDCAPTAETIRFLSLPDILSWYMERLFPVGRRLTGIVRPWLSRVTTMPVASDAVFEATRRFYARLDGVRELLTDGERSSVRLVVNPERMVIAEARRTYTYLSLFGYHVDAVIANRLLPDAVTDPWFKAWK
jgi:arsenite-transporting ATPase